MGLKVQNGEEKWRQVGKKEESRVVSDRRR